jgi:hypothetical protein
MRVHASSFRVLCLIAGLALLYAVAANAEAANRRRAPKDFAVYFEDSHGNKIDTVKGEVTKDLVDQPDRTIQVWLTREEKERIYAKFVEYRLFDLREPSPQTDSGRFEEVAPSISIRFEVTANGVVKRFSWPGQSTNNTSSHQWRRLRLALGFVRGVVEARPEYRRLPKPKAAYL